VLNTFGALESTTMATSLSVRPVTITGDYRSLYGWLLFPPCLLIITRPNLLYETSSSHANRAHAKLLTASPIPFSYPEISLSQIALV